MHEMFRYEISGYYFADEERIHFDEILEATDNTKAMAQVIGFLVFKCIREDKAFKLDTIHYECL